MLLVVRVFNSERRCKMYCANISPNNYHFRNLHPCISIGTASDRYGGWIGQVYSSNRYKNKITRRNKRVGGSSFQEEILPVESIEEYFEHFSILEVDFTFYTLLLDGSLNPTQSFHVLRTYKEHIGQKGRLILKVPQIIFSKKLWRKNQFIENPDYLNARLFSQNFYEPAIGILGTLLKGFIFEQEYHLKKERFNSESLVAALHRFLEAIPRDDRYHIELRTESYLTPTYFNLLETFGVGQVLSHWTWLPTLRTQFEKGDNTFLNSGNQCVVRLVTPRNVKYEDSYKQSFPFRRLVNGMMSREMIEDTVALMQTAIDQAKHINIAINNRAGGNAPMIARELATGFLERHSKDS